MGKGFLPAVQSLQFGGDLTRTPSWHDDRAVLFWRLAKMDREARNVTNAADNDLSRMAQALETSGDYRVLRRLVPRDVITPIPADHPIKVGILLDVETTGLDTKT